MTTIDRAKSHLACAIKYTAIGSFAIAFLAMGCLVMLMQWVLIQQIGFWPYLAALFGIGGSGVAITFGIYKLVDWVSENTSC